MTDTQADGPGQGGMTEEQLREALEKLRVEDVLLQTVATLIDLAARRMGLAEEDGEKQLDQAKLAIDAIRALNPLLTEEQQAAVREPLSQLQLAYAREAKTPAAREASGAPAPGPEAEGSEGKAGKGSGSAAAAAGSAPEAPGGSDDDDAARAAARAKIWTPPGT